jgi:two-component system, NtrC family, response regulator AtoC
MHAAKDRSTILVADDDTVIRGNLALLLRSEGYDVIEARDGLEASRALAEQPISLALLDLKMPRKGGMDVLREHGERVDETPVIVVTALGGSAAAIEAMKLGAYDYVSKPFDLDEVLFTVRRALVQRSLVAQVQSFEHRDEASGDEELIGNSPRMLSVFKTIGRVAATSEPVLITGESGTGKEVVASSIHANSPRSGRPFIKVNCAALSPNLLESELFGHERGAFTGAISRRRGRFEQADGGTLFLDEVGELGIELQAKLLRVVQTGKFELVGGETTIATDVRIVAATNRDLLTSIAEKRFREDLYYRLNVVAIELPPLRERRDDIPLLAEHIISRLARKYAWPHLGLSPETVRALCEQPWEGNVRQLQNVLVRAAILTRGRTILEDDLRLAVANSKAPAKPTMPSFDLKEILAETERRVIAEALVQTRWNRTRAAELLGISRRQLFDKIQQHGLQNPSDPAT